MSESDPGEKSYASVASTLSALFYRGTTTELERNADDARDYETNGGGCSTNARLTHSPFILKDGAKSSCYSRNAGEGSYFAENIEYPWTFSLIPLQLSFFIPGTTKEWTARGPGEDGAGWSRVAPSSFSPPERRDKKHAT